MPLAVMVNISAPLPPLTSAVSLPAPPSNEVAAFAGIPDHAIVAGLAEDLVVARAAGQHVVALAAEQQVVAAFAEQRVVASLAEQLIGARSAGERVVASAAEQIGAGNAPLDSFERDRVVAALAEHLDLAGVGDRGRSAQDGHGAAVDEKIAGRVAADRDGVAGASPKAVSKPVAGVEAAP